MLFVGSNQTSLIYSRQTAIHIDDRLLQQEAALYNTKWWDYRFAKTEDGGFRPIHPMEATYWFTHCFIKASKEAIKKRVDYRKARFKTNLSNTRLLDPMIGEGHELAEKMRESLKGTKKKKNAPADITGMWKARQIADRYGVPYDFWCTTAMVYAETCNWKDLPRPRQLYSSDMVKFILDAWKLKTSTQLLHAESAFYRKPAIEQKPMHPYQKEHLSYLLRRLDRTQNKPILLATLLYKKEIMLSALVLHRYGEREGGNLIERARDFVT